MSYILEALKKAQAERQLGNAPTIHAPQPVHAAQPGAAASRRPLLAGLGAGALVVVLGGLYAWQRTPAPPPQPAAVAASGQPAAAPALAVQPAAPPASAVPAQVPVQVPPTASSAAAGAASTTLEVSAPPAAPAAPPRPAHVAEPPVPSAAPARPTTAARAGESAAPARIPATAPVTTPAPAAAPSPEDSLPYLAQLPDTMQREVPRVAFGGYMYSANPADRLLLVDKTLRHEGEEVAPGLMLEKLLPKAAVMNYRGMRYRVPY
jgi:general secretion pathway protein B